MMGPSLSESMVGATVGSKGTVFQQKTYMKRNIKGHGKGQKRTTFGSIGMELQTSDI